MNINAASIIVSLTSYPARIGTVHQVVRSLLTQTVKAWKIVLWLAREEFPGGVRSLPPELIALTKEKNFMIDWCENIRSYKKLIPSLRKNPDSVIVTVDDDLLYPPDTLKRLVEAYQEAPNSIQALRVRIITAKSGEVQPFLDWLPTWIGDQGSAPESFDNHLIGFGGVLYPPKCLDRRVLDMSTAMEICSEQDDLWFWAMALLKGTKVVGVSCKGFNPVPIAQAAESGLWVKNCVNGGNDIALHRLFTRFPELKMRLSLFHPPLPKSARHLGGLIRSTRDGSRVFSVRINVPIFQMKYNKDFSRITYYILKVPVFRKRLDHTNHE